MVNAGDVVSVSGLGRSPGEGNGNPLQYSCLENPMDGGAWWATGHVVAKSRTQLRDFTFTFFMKNTYICTATPLHLHTLFLFLATLGLPCCTELSLVVTSRGQSPLRCASVSCGGVSFGGVWALGARASAAVVHRPTCSVVCGFFLD